MGAVLDGEPKKFYYAAHNLEVAGSNPAPATILKDIWARGANRGPFSLVTIPFHCAGFDSRADDLLGPPAAPRNQPVSYGKGFHSLLCGWGRVSRRGMDWEPADPAREDC